VSPFPRSGGDRAWRGDGYFAWNKSSLALKKRRDGCVTDVGEVWGNRLQGECARCFLENAGRSDGKIEHVWDDARKNGGAKETRTGGKSSGNHRS